MRLLGFAAAALVYSRLNTALSIAGFGATIVIAMRAERAAKSAEQAAQLAKGEIFRSNAMIELSTARGSLRELKSLQREKQWPQLPDKYSALRETLISIRAGRPGLSAQHQSRLQDAIAQLRALEQRVEKSLESGGELPLAKLNQTVSDMLDSLSAVLGELGSNTNG